LALFLWNTRPLNPPATGAQTSASLEAQRAELLTATDLIRLALKPGGAEEGTASAELLWSTARQTGFLDLRQVRPNDPAREQYQLWIVDPLRDPAAPVDAGVFDVAPNGTGLVRFTPKLPIISPGAFAITREQTGGVVKSRAASPVLVASVR
jgi:anti-sigma-K factor RskA